LKSNVTQVLQGLLVREKEVAAKFRLALGVSKEEALEAAKAYKELRRTRLRALSHISPLPR
jgi:hypothetical protein